MQPLKESKDKSAQDYEYEKMQNECSFKPQILKQSQDNSFFKTMNQSQSLANIHSTQKSIERMNRARQEKEQLEQIKQTGKHRNDRQGLTEMQSPNRSMNKSMTSSASALKTKSINRSQIREKQTNQIPRKQKEQINQQAFDDYLGANFLQHNSNINNINDLNVIDTITQQKNQNQLNDYINQNNNIANSFPQTPNEQQQLQQQQQQQQQIQQLPLLYVDINLGEGNMERITVFPGDTAQELAQKFAKIHGLEDETMFKLQDLLEQQIQNVLVNGQTQ